MSEWKDMDNAIYCLGCGQRLHPTEGIVPGVFGYGVWYCKCSLCNHLQKLVINVLRIEPDIIPLIQKHRKEEHKK